MAGIIPGALVEVEWKTISQRENGIYHLIVDSTHHDGIRARDFRRVGVVLPKETDGQWSNSPGFFYWGQIRSVRAIPACV